jgi:hypothetical protein
MHSRRALPLVLSGLPLAILFAAPAVHAVVPDPCAFVTVAEVNAIVGGAAVKAESKKTPSQASCIVVDQAKNPVYTLDIEEDPDPRKALKELLTNAEKQHKKPGKVLAGIGDQAAYVENMRVVYAAKGKYFVFSYFGNGKYNTEPNIAKLSEAVIKRIK